MGGSASSTHSIDVLRSYGSISLLNGVGEGIERDVFFRLLDPTISSFDSLLSLPPSQVYLHCHDLCNASCTFLIPLHLSIMALKSPSLTFKFTPFPLLLLLLLSLPSHSEPQPLIQRRISLLLLYYRTAFTSFQPTTTPQSRKRTISGFYRLPCSTSPSIPHRKVISSRHPFSADVKNEAI